MLHSSEFLILIASLAIPLKEGKGPGRRGDQVININVHTFAGLALCFIVKSYKFCTILQYQRWLNCHEFCVVNCCMSIPLCSTCLVDFKTKIQDKNIARVQTLLGERTLADAYLLPVTVEMEKAWLVLSRLYLAESSFSPKGLTLIQR